MGAAGRLGRRHRGRHRHRRQIQLHFDLAGHDRRLQLSRLHRALHARAQSRGRRRPDATPQWPRAPGQGRNGGGQLLVKDEGRLPTGSFKARGLVMAVSMAKALGISHMAMPTNGNAGAALAAYASRAGIRTTVFCPEDTPEVNVSEIALQGAKVYRVNGLIDDCGKIVAEGRDKAGWVEASTLKEPYRIEGKKTMGLELAEQLGWDVPDVILYP